jgi:uncharacterized protein YegP (UPF0339 family)
MGDTQHLDETPVKLFYHVIVFKGNDSQWYWRIKHVNGNKLATSEGYTQKSSAYVVAYAIHANLLNSDFSTEDDTQEADTE